MKGSMCTPWVLEEEIRFSSEGEAQECLKIFKRLNITAHLKQMELESRMRV
jgi:hypothetical protein